MKTIIKLLVWSKLLLTPSWRSVAVNSIHHLEIWNVHYTTFSWILMYNTIIIFTTVWWTHHLIERLIYNETLASSLLPFGNGNYKHLHKTLKTIHLCLIFIANTLYSIYMYDFHVIILDRRCSIYSLPILFASYWDHAVNGMFKSQQYVLICISNKAIL